MKYFLFAMIVSATCFAQESADYVIPFASEGNRIELAVENTGALTSSNITIEVAKSPSWMTFTSTKEIIPQLRGQTQLASVFSFSIDRTAPIGRKENLVFLLSLPNGQSWTKEIVVSVGPPEKFELFQNYPNPFNPTTTISYQLSSPGRVRLVVYNLLGQEVARLVDTEREAGFYQELWNASFLASGLYIYRITATDRSGDKILQNKTMSLVK